MTVGDRVLDWMLRRLKQGTALEQDVVLIVDHPALEDAPEAFHLGGESWRIARVGGEITLRDALPEGDRLVAILPPRFVPPPDVTGRAYLGRPLEVKPEDVVAALAQRWCEPLIDEDLAGAVLQDLDLLREYTGRWSLGAVVTAREVRNVLTAAELGSDHRLDKEAPDALLARWIIEGPPPFRVHSLLASALRDAHGRAGEWLAWAASEGSCEALVAAGALVGSEAGTAHAPDVPGLGGSRERHELKRLVEQAVRAAHARAPERTVEVLGKAEALSHRVALDPREAGAHPLLRGVLDRALHDLARAAADGEPATDADVQALRSNLHARSCETAIALVAHASRLARFVQRVPSPDDSEPVEAWLRLASRHVAWADWALRDLRRLLAAAPADLVDPARIVLARTLAHRDALNASFGRALARDWPRIASSKDVRAPLPLHQVSRCLLRRLVDDGHRVLLVVLDGCDLSTFLEIVSALEPDDPVGLALPSVTDVNLRDDLAGATALHVGVAALPTVTSHSRRALFAGEIPGNTALDDTESPAANASGDQTAFGRNAALDKVPRRLFLKGDLGADGHALHDALREGAERLLAVVFNGVDDALSSKETTALGPWSLAALGAGASEAIRLAVDQGWTVLVTADHGHTPYVDPSRKVSPKAIGARFGATSATGSVAFASGPLPREPLHLLTAVGAWHGNQHRGFHGGAGLEEVAVPLAFLGRVSRGEGRPIAPGWWWSSEEVEVEPAPPPQPAAPAPKPPTASSALPSDVRSRFLDQPKKLMALELLREHQVLNEDHLAKLLNQPPIMARGFMGQILAELSRAGIPLPFDASEQAGKQVYRWKIGR